MRAVTVGTKFTAIDKFSRVVKKMSRNTSTFVKKAEVGFARVQRAERRMRKGLRKSLGFIGRLGLGLGFGALAIAMNITTATVELDKNLASLRSITGVSQESFKQFAKEIERVSKAEKVFAGDTANAFSLVGSAQPELLKNADALGKVTQASLVLAKASGMEVAQAVDALTIAMNMYGASADDASSFVDIYATSQQKGTARIIQLDEAMRNAGSTARAFSISFEDTNAFIQAFAKGGIVGSEAGTQLAGVLAKLSKVAKKEFNPVYTKASDVIDNLSKANLSYTELIKLTDVRGAKWLSTLINQNETLQKLTGNLNDTNNAQIQADINTNTLIGRWTQLVDSFKNAVTSTDSENTALNSMKKLLVYVADNMDSVIRAVKIAATIFLIYKGVMVSAKIALMAYNAIVFISGVFTGTLTKATVAGRIAMMAWSFASKIAAGSQWLLNAAMAANPVFLIILAITALIVLISVFSEDIKKMFKDLSVFFKNVWKDIGDIPENFEKNMNTIKTAFQKEGFSGGFSATGTIVEKPVINAASNILGGLNKVGLLSFVPGFQSLSGKIDTEPLNVDAKIEESKIERQEFTKNNNSTLEIINKSENDVNLKTNDESGINLSGILGW